MTKETENWDEYVEHVLGELVPMIESSAATVSLLPSGQTDVKFAIELGLSIMLDKPIIAMLMPGVRIPEHLARVVDGYVEYDPDDMEGTHHRLQQALERLGITDTEGEPNG
jgi:hypothetical protein